MDFFLSLFAPEILVSQDVFFAVPSRISPLILNSE